MLEVKTEHETEREHSQRGTYMIPGYNTGVLFH